MGNQTLINTLKPLTWLVGKWEGRGNGGFPTIESFSYIDQMTFKLLPDAYAQEPLIQFEEIAWVEQKNGKIFKHWETGFFRPLNDNTIELQVTHNTGRVEVLQGAFEFIDDQKQCFKIAFLASFLHNAEGLTVATSSEKVLEFSKNRLKFIHSMATIDVPENTKHLQVWLKRVGG